MNHHPNPALGRPDDPPARTGASRARAQDVDRQVALRLRERRLVLGLTQQQMAERLGITYQQFHKYEVDHNRIAAARLFGIAQVLGVEVDYFFDRPAHEGMRKPTAQQRLLLELARNFALISCRAHQEAICRLARSMAEGEGDLEPAGTSEAA
jgi:transcriptional regulator with XRE-family HTH domain